MARVAHDVIAEANHWLGVGENPPGSNNNVFTEEYGIRGPWCDMYQSHNFRVAGLPEEHYASTILDVANGREEGRFIEGRLGGQVGDKVFFHWPNSTRPDNEPDHVGLVEKIESDGVYICVEGNVGDMVKRTRRAANILGFKRPKYDGNAEPTGPVQVEPAPVPHEAQPPAPTGPGRTFGPLDFDGMVKKGSSGKKVEQVQQVLKDRGWDIEVDGKFGPKTDAVVRAFQHEKGLEEDGIVGPATKDALVHAPVT